ncbi:hypothetical protein B5S31_g5430 [[Candida] boidinii]|uniref:Unnamed protein product n=1 Tax=Candida boidinii TaxID=5477 RepID=A0ACB5U0T8_CANBO|nr:hypothetical protein B5S29_g3453 [[Candida] boidinii]OWB75521.1 hypothetical protein B5S31_g5430 [[Candida] boidinii]GME70672.1 unnamed protein product [[Candida] boidinii]GME98718.1 unnamed protein product [[Candida] boidinii]
MDLKVINTIVYSILISSSYVLALYFKSSHTVNKTFNRNDPNVIKDRLTRSIVITILNLIILPFVVKYIIESDDSTADILNNLGLLPGFKIHENNNDGLLGLNFEFSYENFKITLLDNLKTLLLFMILFIGPLFANVYYGLNYLLEDIVAYPRWEFLRDLVISPLTEELIYTCCITSIFIPLISDGLIDLNSILIFTPLLFGMAHLHHAVELYKSHKHKLIAIVLTCLLQMMYTTLFGTITNYIFIRTGSIWCCFISHAFCNANGLPALTIHSNSKFIKLFYNFLLIIGIFFFFFYFDSLTISENGLLKIN